MSQKKTLKRKGFTKARALLISFALLILCSVGATLAYLTANSGTVTNTFSEAKVTPVIHEVRPEDNSNVKKNVYIENDGNIRAFIRAAVVVTWQDEAGNVMPVAPVEGTDYTVDWYDSGWERGNADGFYYYLQSVDPDGVTSNLIDSCSVLNTENAQKYHLSVEILAEAIQADGTTEDGTPAVTKAWGVGTSVGGN